jgi:thiosulfate/3-mercaptopyruvate sulfurtransferase
LPEAATFAAAMTRSGIGPDTHVIAYDFGDGSTAARLWWLLHWLGHDLVSLLDGGFARWQAEGRPLESRVPAYPPARFAGAPRPGMVVNADEVEWLRDDPGTLMLDARAPERYEGRTEPIDPAAGHVPGARNHPYASNVRSADDPRFLDPARLRERFEALGADRAARVVAYCGSGVTACQDLFALQLAGIQTGVLYEGSWSDWCSVPTRPVRTGASP